MSVELASNGFSYAPIKSTREQRIERLCAEIQTRKALTMSEIRRICNYTQSNNARELAEALVWGNPDVFCLVPNRTERKTKTETVKLVL